MELRIRWAVTISLILHIFLLLLFIWSGVYFRSARLSSNLQAIQVSLVKEHTGKVREKIHLVKKQKSREPLKKVKKILPEKKSISKPSRVSKIQAIKKVSSRKSAIKERKKSLHATTGIKEIKQNKKEKNKKEVNKKTVQSAKVARATTVKSEKSLSSAGVSKSPEKKSVRFSQTPGKKLKQKVVSIKGPYGNLEVEDLKFKYDYYLNLIRSKIDSRWDQPVAYKNPRQVLVEFIIRRNGRIENIHVKESSGDFFFDQTAVRAVRLSNPFPPLPRGYKEDFLKVKYRFIFGGEG